MARLVLLAFLLPLIACGDDETGTSDTDTGGPEGPVFAACDFPDEHTCSNLLDSRQSVVWDTYGCEDSGGVVLEGECPRSGLLGACVLEDVEFLYYQDYQGHDVEYLMSYCAESGGVWVEE